MRALSLLLFLSAACSYPQFEAKRTLEFAVPAAGVQGLECISHNGGIRVVGTAGLTEIAVQVELSTRGNTQEEADANLAQLDVRRDVANGVLNLAGIKPADLPDNCSPGFAFTVAIPRECRVGLQTHNGSIEVRGTQGAVQLRTHNGRLIADVVTDKVNLETHNGSVELTAQCDASLSGRIETHNGSVTVALPDNADTTVVASTHNGGIDVAGGASVKSQGKSRVEASYGTGAGKLSVTTHNGHVQLK